MARLKYIPPALWERLARLDRFYDFTISRGDVPRNRYASGRNFDRYWVVKLIERGEDGRTISGEGTRLADVLKGAVELAEDRVARKQAS